MSPPNAMLRVGAFFMLIGALLLFIYALVFVATSYFTVGFQIGVDQLGEATPEKLDALSASVMAYIRHLHFAAGGFLAGLALALGGLTWYGVLRRSWWAWCIGLAAPAVAMLIAMPLNFYGGFAYDWILHLGPLYACGVLYGFGLVVAMFGLMIRPATGAAKARNATAPAKPKAAAKPTRGTKTAAKPAAKPVPATPEPAKVEAARSEPEKPEPGKSEPAKPEPAMAGAPEPDERPTVKRELIKPAGEKPFAG